jgi:Domain of unknown function (DUF4158)
MPVSFLTSAQQESYGRYAAPPSPDELTRFFHLSEDDQALTLSRRGDHNRLGFALQLTTVRFLGTFLENSMTVPSEIVQTLSRQLGITKSEAIDEYRQGRWRRQHAAEIRERFGYRDFSDPAAGFRLARWLCALCWTGTERPSVLFDRALQGRFCRSNFGVRGRSRRALRSCFGTLKGSGPSKVGPPSHVEE